MKKSVRALVLLSCVLIFAAQANLAQQKSSSTIADAEAQLLEPRKSVARELKAGETHAYKIALEEGQFLDAAVNQRGIDVVVRVLAPDGNRISEIDSPNGTQGDEPIALEVKVSGTYRIEVSPLGQVGNASAGSYEIRINELLSADAYARRLAAKSVSSKSWSRGSKKTRFQ